MNVKDEDVIEVLEQLDRPHGREISADDLRVVNAAMKQASIALRGSFLEIGKSVSKINECLTASLKIEDDAIWET